VPKNLVALFFFFFFFFFFFLFTNFSCAVQQGIRLWVHGPNGRMGTPMPLRWDTFNSMGQQLQWRWTVPFTMFAGNTPPPATPSLPSNLVYGIEFESTATQVTPAVYIDNIEAKCPWEVRGGGARLEEDEQISSATKGSTKSIITTLVLSSITCVIAIWF
jgi:hypothetical protein